MLQAQLLVHPLENIPAELERRGVVTNWRAVWEFCFLLPDYLRHQKGVGGGGGGGGGERGGVKICRKNITAELGQSRFLLRVSSLNLSPVSLSFSLLHCIIERKLHISVPIFP